MYHQCFWDFIPQIICGAELQLLCQKITVTTQGSWEEGRIAPWWWVSVAFLLFWSSYLQPDVEKLAWKLVAVWQLFVCVPRMEMIVLLPSLGYFSSFNGSLLSASDVTIWQSMQVPLLGWAWGLQCTCVWIGAEWLCLALCHWGSAGPQPWLISSAKAKISSWNQPLGRVPVGNTRIALAVWFQGVSETASELWASVANCGCILQARLFLFLN